MVILTIFLSLVSQISFASVVSHYEMSFKSAADGAAKNLTINTGSSGYEIEYRVARDRIIFSNVDGVYFDTQNASQPKVIGKPQALKDFAPVVISGEDAPVVLANRGWDTLDVALVFPSGNLFRFTLESRGQAGSGLSADNLARKIQDMEFSGLIKNISISNVIEAGGQRLAMVSVDSVFGAQSYMVSMTPSRQPGWEPETHATFLDKYFFRYPSIIKDSGIVLVTEGHSDTQYSYSLSHFLKPSERDFNLPSGRTQTSTSNIKATSTEISGYEIENSEEGLFVMRLSDGKKVKMSAVRLTKNPEPHIEHGILSIPGVKRSISLNDFDMETSFTPTGVATSFRTNDRTVDPWKEIYENFEELNLSDAKNFYFSPEDESSIKKMTKTLRRMGPKSFVLLGDPGTGKSVLIKQALRTLPKSWRILELRSDSFESGGQYVGSLADKIRTIIEVSKEAPIVLVVDEFHTLTGAGTHKGDPNDILQKLKSQMATGQVILAGTDTPEEFYESITDGALLRRLNQVQMPEYTEESVKLKLRSWLSAFGLQQPDDKTLEKVIRLSSEFFPNDSEPFRTTQVFDQILTNFEPTDMTWEITEDRIAEAIKDMTKRDPREWGIEGIRQKLAELPKKYRKKVAGSDQVLPKLLSMTRNTLFGLKASEGPGVRLLMVGPHGVGKSLRARAYAQAVGASYREIDMTRYMNLNAEYLVSEIAEQLMKDPHSVIFFDELEKSSVEAQRVLLTILSSDYFYAKIKTQSGNLRNRRLTTRFMKVIAATNAGFHRHSQDNHKSTMGFLADVNRGDVSASRHRNLIDLLKEEIEPALIDRMAGEYNIAEIMPPQGRDLRQVLLLKVSEHLDRFHHQNSLQAKFMAKGMGSFVDKWVDYAEKRTLSPREVERDMLAELDNVISAKIESGALEERGGRVEIRHEFVTSYPRKAASLICRQLLE